MAGLNPGASQFFIFCAITLTNALVAGAIFGLIGAIAPNVTVGNILVHKCCFFFLIFFSFFLSRFLL